MQHVLYQVLRLLPAENLRPNSLWLIAENKLLLKNKEYLI